MQVGVVNFEPYEGVFMSTFSRARASYPAYPMTGSIYRHLQRNWGDPGPKGGLPAVGLKLNDLVQRLQVSTVGLPIKHHQYCSQFSNEIFLLIL